MKPYYRVERKRFPFRDIWRLRCAETGAVYPNGPDRVGQPFKHWATAEEAVWYAKCHNIPLVNGDLA